MFICCGCSSLLRNVIFVSAFGSAEVGSAKFPLLLILIIIIIILIILRWAALFWICWSLVTNVVGRPENEGVAVMKSRDV